MPYGETGARRRVLRRRVALGLAVHRRRRGEDDADAVACRCLEHALRREHVALDVEREHVAEARTPGWPARWKTPSKPAKSSSSSARSMRAHVQPLGVLLLERRVVVVGEAVDADDLVRRAPERSARCEPMKPAAPVTTYSRRASVVASAWAVSGDQPVSAQRNGEHQRRDGLPDPGRAGEYIG